MCIGVISDVGLVIVSPCASRCITSYVGARAQARADNRQAGLCNTNHHKQNSNTDYTMNVKNANIIP